MGVFKISKFGKNRGAHADKWGSASSKANRELSNRAPSINAPSVKAPSILFISVCLMICLVPSAGMIFASSSETIGNESSTSLPSLLEPDGSPNLEILSDLGGYFEKNFAFRSQIITADAKLQASLFGVSNIDTVVVGQDDWLFYSSTLDDYLARNTLTQNQAQGVVHNLELISQCAEDAGARFLFVIAPNKNTLYGEKMPYYYGVSAESASGNARNRDLIHDALANSSVDYCNLFDLFEGRDDVLYLKRDSHWTNEGALLAANKMMSALDKDYIDYGSEEVVRRKDFAGDLADMIYPADPGEEYNSYYLAEQDYTHDSRTGSVEDSLIKTHRNEAAANNAEPAKAAESDTDSAKDDSEVESLNGSLDESGVGAEGSRLYMYRDSFGNALLPFFAANYDDAVFTKSFPMIYDYDLGQYTPDTVIFEIAERNVEWFITQPPVMEAPLAREAPITAQEEIEIQVTAKICEYSPMYIEVKGTLGYDERGEWPSVYISVNDNGDSPQLFETYDYLDMSGGEGIDGANGVGQLNGSDGFLAYINASDYAGCSHLDIGINVWNGQGYTKLGSTSVEIEE